MALTPPILRPPTPLPIHEDRLMRIIAEVAEDVVKRRVAMATKEGKR